MLDPDDRNGFDDMDDEGTWEDRETDSQGQNYSDADGGM